MSGFDINCWHVKAFDSFQSNYSQGQKVQFNYCTPAQKCAIVSTESIASGGAAQHGKATTTPFSVRLDAEESEHSAWKSVGQECKYAISAVKVRAQLESMPEASLCSQQKNCGFMCKPLLSLGHCFAVKTDCYS